MQKQLLLACLGIVQVRSNFLSIEHTCHGGYAMGADTRRPIPLPGRHLPHTPMTSVFTATPAITPLMT